MANSTTNLDLLIPSQNGKEATLNALTDAASPAMLFGRRASTCGGLNFGLYGGNFLISGQPVAVANQIIALTPTTQNYIVAEKATGVVSSATTTTNWNSAAFTKLYTAQTNATQVTDYFDFRTVAAPDVAGFLNAAMLTAKGSIIAASGAGAAAELQIGADGTALVASATSPNGLSWQNISSISATPATTMYPGTTVLQPINTQCAYNISSMSKTPEFGSEVVDVIAVTAANSPKSDGIFLYDAPIGVAAIPTGAFEFRSFASVDSVAGGRVSRLRRNVCLVEIGSGTLTISGSGTSRTATATGASFLAPDFGATDATRSYVRTPAGIFPITSFASATAVGIAALATYTNENAVNFTIFRFAFGIDSSPITAITPDYQPMVDRYFITTPINLLPTTKLAFIPVGISNNTTAINYVHGGTVHYSHFSTTLVGAHNDLPGLNAGDFQHLTVAEKAAIEVNSNRDATGGYPSLSGFALKLKNAAGTFVSLLTTVCTAARAYTLQDRDGTLADLTDIAGRAAVAGLNTQEFSVAAATAADRAVRLEQLGVLPQNSQSAAYTTVLTDAGKHLLHPSADTTPRTFTIDSNASVAYPIGAAITFINQNLGGVITIAINADTMRLAGPGTTGSRTLAANGTATAIKVAATEWLISGVGLT